MDLEFGIQHTLEGMGTYGEMSIYRKKSVNAQIV